MPVSSRIRASPRTARSPSRTSRRAAGTSKAGRLSRDTRTGFTVADPDGQQSIDLLLDLRPRRYVRLTA
jgi:hypothetical protein